MAQDQPNANAASLSRAQRILDHFMGRNADDPFFKRTGPLTIVRQLGRGGSGEVFMIESDSGGRYALKIVDIRDPKEFQRSNREIQTRVLLQNIPFVVYYESFGTLFYEDRYSYLIFMPYMETVLDIYDRITPYDEDRVIEVGIDISCGLSVCHGGQIIHRDVKPGNVFVSETDRFPALAEYGDYLRSKKWPLFVLGDFSNAKNTAGSTGETGTVAMGSSGFEPPEILMGGVPGAPYDIYSLGAVLYWCANNNSASPRDYAVDASVNAGSRFRNRPANGSDALWNIICRATQIDPARRYQSAAELRGDLVALRTVRQNEQRTKDFAAAENSRLRWQLQSLAAQPVTAAPKAESKPASGRDKPRSRSRRAVVALALVMMAVLLIASTYVWAMPLIRYRIADNHFRNGRYDEAFWAFYDLGDYSDSEDMAQQSRYLLGVSLYEEESYEDAYDTFRYLGNYREAQKYMLLALQNRIRTEYSPEKILNVDFGGLFFLVLHAAGGKALLITQDIIFTKEYHDAAEETVSWESCSLRKWLGEYISDNYFTSQELDLVLASQVTDTVGDTDRFFLLSAGEALEYFDDDQDRQAMYNGNGMGWWLRTDAGSAGTSGVAADGKIHSGNFAVCTETLGVRPALWMDISGEGPSS